MRSGGSGFPMPPFLQMMTAGMTAGQSALKDEISPASNAFALANCEMIGLMSKRSRAYLEWPSTALSCKSPQELLAKQQAFFQQCVQDYSAAVRAANQIWSVALPVTGMEETLEDESLQSCPENQARRDTLDVRSGDSAANRAKKRQAAASQQAA